MSDVKVVKFGLGEVVSNWGTYEGMPCVFLEPADAPGAIGDVAAGYSGIGENPLRPGTVVLQFHKREGVKILLEDIHTAIAKQYEQELREELAAKEPQC